jgi:nitrous oxide reductase accessory protein NosL
MGSLWHSRRAPWVLTAAVLALGGLAWWSAATWRTAPPPVVVAEMEADFCVVAPPTPYDPASGLALSAARAVPADARCPVCGMYPARSLDWAGQIIFSNGDAQFFDSPVSLLMFLNDVPRYSAGRTADDIVARYVTDVSSKEWIDAGAAFYVYGSNALGPMRAGNLPAFAQRSAAEEFAKRRGGEVRVLGAIDAQMLQSMSSRHQH